MRVDSHASRTAPEYTGGGREGKVDFGKRREKKGREFVVNKTFRYIVQCVFVNVLGNGRKFSTI